MTSSFMFMNKLTDIIHSKQQMFMPGTLFTWLWAHSESYPNATETLRGKLRELVDPRLYPEVSSKRYGTRDDIFLPDFVDILTGVEGSRGNIDGLKYSSKLFGMMKYSSSPAEVFNKKSFSEVSKNRHYFF